MYLETYAFGTYINTKKEKFTETDVLDSETIFISVIYIFYIFLWLYTISVAIESAKKVKKHSGSGLIIATVSWPFYWIFKYTKALG